jgi:hypothetical protein
MGEGLPQVGCFMTQFPLYVKENNHYTAIQ